MKLPRFFVGKNTTDLIRNSLKVPQENVLSLRKKDDFKVEINFTRIKDFFTKNKKLATPLGIIALVLVVFSFALKGKATIVNFYPETCLGGWENPSNASGQPSVSSEAQGSDFTRDNSAFLRNRTAQMFCGDFGGEVPTDTVPRKFTVRFSWFVDDGSYDKGEKIINEALDEGRNFDDTPDLSEETELDSTDGQTSEESVENTSSTSDESPQETIPSNEGGASDLPSGDTSTEETNTQTDTQSEGSDEGSTSSDNADSSDTSSGDSSSGAESSGGESGGNEGAFLEKLLNKAFAQESESVSVEAPENTDSPTSQSVVDENISNNEPAETENQDSNTNESSSEDASNINQENTPSGTTDAESISSNESPSETQNNEETEVDVEVQETNGIVSLDETARDDLFRVMYTLDGKTWEELGIIKRNNWKNAEFEIPFSSVDSWEKLSKVQIAIESLPTIDSFPETYLDSIWVSVEYQDRNPDPLPQPDFLTDKVLQDLNYEEYRVIKIAKPDGEIQLWYAIIPESLRESYSTKTSSLDDEVIQEGNASLEVVDVSTLPVETQEKIEDSAAMDVMQVESAENKNDEKVSETQKETSSTEVKVEKSDTTLFENIGNLLGAQVINSIDKSDDNDTLISENLNEASVQAENTETNSSPVQNQEESTFTSSTLSPQVLDISTKDDDSDSVEKDPVDLQELNKPLWYWDLIARGPEVHGDLAFALEDRMVFWVNALKSEISGFFLLTKGRVNTSYQEGTVSDGLPYFNGANEPRFARFDEALKKFVFISVVPQTQ